MKKRWMLWCALVVAVAAVAVMIEPNRIVRGWLRGQQFFASRPSSYWSKVIRDRDLEGRFASAVGLDLANEPDPAAVPMLIELLEDEDDQVRFVACNALAANGPRAQRAVPVLLRMLRHSNLFYRRNSSNALAAIGPDASALSTLIEALKEDDSRVNYSAAIAVGKIGPDAKEAVPALVKLMKSKRATDDIVPALSIAFEMRKLGDVSVGYVEPGIPRPPGTGTVGYVAFWALLQIDPALAKANLPGG